MSSDTAGGLPLMLASPGSPLLARQARAPGLLPLWGLFQFHNGDAGLALAVIAQPVAFYRGVAF